MDARIVALAKTIKDKALATAREGLSVGTHPIDCLVRITGTIKVGEDSKVDVRSPDPDYKAAFATAFGLLVKQCERDGNELSEESLGGLIDMAMRQGDAATEIGSEMVEWIATAARNCTKVTGTKPQKGRVTTKLDYSFQPVKAVAA